MFSGDVFGRVATLEQLVDEVGVKFLGHPVPLLSLLQDGIYTKISELPQAEFVRDLLIAEVQTHQVQTQDPSA